MTSSVGRESYLKLDVRDRPLAEELLTGEKCAASLNEATRLSVAGFVTGETGDECLSRDAEDWDEDDEDEVEEDREKFGRKEVVITGSILAELARASFNFSILDFKFAFSL